MDAIRMLVQQLETVNLRLHHSARDLSADELTARPLPGVNSIAFLLWHMARSQDWAVNTAIRDVPEMITRVPWVRSALAVPGIGTGFELEEAASVAARFELPDVLNYADAVHSDALAWLRTSDEAMLDEMDSGPEHDDAVGRTGGLPVWIVLTSVSITHQHRHLGELDLVKGLLRRGFSS